MIFGATAMRYVAVATGATTPTTQTTDAERALLIKHLQGRKQIVEIGVFEGYTTRVLTENADPDAVVYGVDPFFEGRLGICWGYHMARSYNAKSLRDGKLKLIRTLSTEVGQEVPSQIDFVFIDADHSLDGITADWAFWSNRVEADGVIALHDSLVPIHNPRVADFGSHRYFESHIRHDSRFEFIDSVDSLAIMRRRTNEN